MKLKNTPPLNVALTKRRFALFPTQLFYVKKTIVNNYENSEAKLFTKKIWLEYYYENYYLTEELFLDGTIKTVTERYQK